MDTPGYPKAPHSTPSSTRGHHPGLFNLKRPRPPVQNPFDKFSQQDFDAWIGKLTGDLEKALGYEEVTQSQPSLSQATEQTDDGYADSDSYVEDSFAEVKARRVLDKGKARDPREGPGLGPKSGDTEQPIEILSDEESEDEGEQLLESEGSAEGELDESYEEAKGDDGDDERERGGEGSDVETEIWSQRRRRIQATTGESARRPIRGDSAVVESGDSGSDEYEAREEANGRGFKRASSEGIIQLSSDEEVGTASRRREEEEAEEEAFLSEEDAEGVDSPAPALEQVSRHKPQDEEDMQPSDEDTSFPPHSVNIPSDIRDPWAQVAKYAEDYYSGGKVVSNSRVHLSPHHLGNDDDSGFLTPDVVSPDNDVNEEEEEEEEEGEDEFEDEFVKADPEDRETQELEPEPDENDHLFNRLRSYTQPNPSVYSPWRGARTSFVVAGPGSNEEPILIDTDDELEEPSKQHSKAVISDVIHFEEAISTCEDEQSSEFRDHSVTSNAIFEAQDEERTLPLKDEQSSARAMEHLEVPSLQIPSESFIVREVPVPALADAGLTNDNLDITSKHLGLQTHGLADTSSLIPDSNYLVSNSVLPSESDAPTATGDNLGQALDRIAGQLEVESHLTTDASTELDVSSQDNAVKEVDEEVDELDELDDGPLPLMTSDLDYPLESQDAEAKDESARDSAESSEAMSNDDNAFPSQTLEAEDTEQKDFSDIQIFVEEVDDEPGTSFKPITINIQPPTPLVMPESEFEVSPPSANETSSPDSALSEAPRQTSPVAQPSAEKLVSKEVVTEHFDAGIHSYLQAPDQSSGSVERTEEMTEGVEEVSITGIITPDDQESMYVVEEPIIGSKLDEVRHDRGISIDIASTLSDDMVSTVETGHVEEALSDTNVEENIDALYSGAEAEGVHVTNMHSFTEGVKEIEIEEVVATTTTKMPVVTRATPEVIGEDYFAHPSTPMPFADLDDCRHTSTPSGNLPSIIQLPDTPQRVLSPGGTPAPGPTPVSIAVEPGILKVLKENPNLFSATSPPATTSQRSRQNSAAETTPMETKSSNIENTITQQPSSPQPPSSKTPNRMHPESFAQLPTNYPTFLPVATTVKPVLYVDPYPYSLSTPLAYSQPEEDAYEDVTDQDNSFTPSLNETELDGNANNYAPALESSSPSEEALELTEEAHHAQLVNSKTEQSLVELEVEADALIDEFLVDELDSDTDADGEADPEFTVLESSASGRNSEGHKDKELVRQTLLTMDTSEARGVAVKEAGSKEEIKDDIGTLEDGRDVQMNVASPEATDVERTGKSEEKSEKGMQEADAVGPLDSKTVPISEIPAEISSPEIVRVPPPPQAHPSRDTSPGGASPASTGECIRSSHPPAETHVIQHHSPFDVKSGPTDTSQQKEPTSNLPIEQAEITQARSLATLPRIKTQEIPVTAQESGPEGSPRRVQVSLEDPYNADNDSDREQTSRAGKRKRSLSEISNGDSPIAPRSTSIVKGKSKTSRQSSKGISRPRKKASLLSSSIASRSPSVASTVVSDGSSLLSPNYPSLPSSDPRPFIHAHSRRKMGNVPRTVQQQRHKQQQKVVPGSSSQDGLLRAENVLTKAPTGPLVLGSSPMTRSHCRYHKISIPKTENGPRIHFLVPGCSLNDAELIEEEEIEDLGEAIIRGDTLIADKIESIDFEPYLLWAMRQLVGTELLRENEVYYLPEPNETVVRTTQESKKKGVRRLSKRVDEDIASHSQKPAPHSLPSDISSTGSAASALRQIIGGLDDDDMSSITETEEEDNSSLGPQKKEGGQDPPRELDVSPLKGETSTSRKRIRRLGQDAAAYHPSSGEESLSDLSDHNAARKSTRSRGIKRSRPSESNVAGADGRKVKKIKRQRSSSRSPSHAEAGQHMLQRSPSQSDYPTEIRPTSPAPMISTA